jgi:pilus assembly protein CpaB
MKAKSMVLILIALGCGLVASIGISQVMDRGSRNGDAPAVETQRILIAMGNIDINAKLTAQNVKLEEWPKDRIPKGAIASLEEVKESRPRTRLYDGEAILMAKLTNSKGGVIDVVPEGYRVVPVKVSTETVTGLILPGDRVDVIVFLRKSNEIPETSTKTVLHDVRVFDVDGQTEREQSADGQSSMVKTVSVLVKPAQVETLMLASELGKIRLSLRRPDDPTNEDTADGMNIQTMMGMKAQVADDRQEPTSVVPNGEAFFDWIKNQNKPKEAAKSDRVASTEKSPEWKMTILTPEGATHVQWQDGEELPGAVPLPSASAPKASTPTPDAGSNEQPHKEPTDNQTTATDDGNV